MDFVTNQTGQVVSALVIRTTLGHAPTQACLKRAVLHLKPGKLPGVPISKLTLSLRPRKSNRTAP